MSSSGDANVKAAAVGEAGGWYVSLMSTLARGDEQARFVGDLGAWSEQAAAKRAEGDAGSVRGVAGVRGVEGRGDEEQEDEEGVDAGDEGTDRGTSTWTCNGMPFERRKRACTVLGAYAPLSLAPRATRVVGWSVIVCVRVRGLETLRRLPPFIYLLQGAPRVGRSDTLFTGPGAQTARYLKRVSNPR